MNLQEAIKQVLESRYLTESEISVLAEMPAIDDSMKQKIVRTLDMLYNEKYAGNEAVQPQIDKLQKIAQAYKIDYTPEFAIQ